MSASEGVPGSGGRNPDELMNQVRFLEAEVADSRPGCSGMEIAYDLAEGGAARVWLSARTPPNILLRQGPGGVPGDMFGVALLRFRPASRTGSPASAGAWA